MPTDRSFLSLLVIANLAGAAAAAQATRLLPFQARLADATGKPVADGAAVVQFQIFGEPTGGSPLWAGEVHRATVNSGLVNVALGSKNPFPVDRTNSFGAVLGSFFDQPLYLEVRVDSAGSPAGTPDGLITDADPPLLPRQGISAPPFAKEAAYARTAANADSLGSRPAQEVFSAGIPIGGIVPFFGAPSSLPANWKLCNGSVVDDAASPLNGQALPDLREVFLRGASDLSPLGQTGGQDFAGSHSHFFSDNASVFIPLSGGMSGWTGAQSVATRANEFSDTYFALTIRKGVPSNEQTSHGHTGTANVSGLTLDAGAHDNRPSFFSVHYIIRIK